MRARDDEFRNAIGIAVGNEAVTGAKLCDVGANDAEYIFVQDTSASISAVETGHCRAFGTVDHLTCLASDICLVRHLEVDRGVPAPGLAQAPSASRLLHQRSVGTRTSVNAVAGEQLSCRRSYPRVGLTRHGRL